MHSAPSDVTLTSGWFALIVIVQGGLIEALKLSLARYCINCNQAITHESSLSQERVFFGFVLLFYFTSFFPSSPKHSTMLEMSGSSQ